MNSLAQGLAGLVMKIGHAKALEEREMYGKLEKWKGEPMGDHYGHLLRVSSESGRTTGHITRNAELDDPQSDYFQFPQYGYVVADAKGPFWGIYGLLDGLGDWNHLPRYKNAVWQILVVQRDECKPDPMGGGVRVPRGWVKYSGDAVGALQIMIPIMRDKGILNQIFTHHMHDWVKKIEGI